VAAVVYQRGQPLTAEQCGEHLKNRLDIGQIQFSGGKEDVSTASYDMLDRVSAVLQRCPDAVVEVGAHSDADGSEENNLALTEARAEAVVDYLVDAGVRRERLIAVGYGESQPVADNDTEAGKAANRRVEFAVSSREDD
jgi:OOP family OmpA-OmpF porin